MTCSGCYCSWKTNHCASVEFIRRYKVYYIYWQGKGRTCAITETNDRYIPLTSHLEGTDNATQLKIQLFFDTRQRVLNETARNCFIYVRKPMFCILLTSSNCAAPEKWAIEHRVWKHPYWWVTFCLQIGPDSIWILHPIVLAWRGRGT